MKLSLTIPSDVHYEFKCLCAQSKVSMSKEITRLLRIHCADQAALDFLGGSPMPDDERLIRGLTGLNSVARGVPPDAA